MSKDVDFMQRLSNLTNVIPIIAKSDVLSPAEVVEVKTSILAQLQVTPIKPFLFGKAVEDALLTVQGLPIVAASSPDPKAAAEPAQYPFNIPTYPYAISTNPGQDLETMDASLLMSPDYVQPLLPSELATLVNQVFDPENISWLRHSAAKKFLAWRRRTSLMGESSILRGLQPPTLRPGSPPSSSVGLTGAAYHGMCTLWLLPRHADLSLSFRHFFRLLRHVSHWCSRSPQLFALLLQFQHPITLLGVVSLPLTHSH
jgi:hypothetical protein